MWENHSGKEGEQPWFQAWTDHVSITGIDWIELMETDTPTKSGSGASIWNLPQSAAIQRFPVTTIIIMEPVINDAAWRKMIVIEEHGKR